MARHYFLRTLCTLPIFSPGALSHMQMQVPSPLRDPHSNRASEPKDYNILTPLNSDGSDFTCKGYQWNTPLTPVAEYEAGGTYPLVLKGGAIHGGGSCQVSLSCDNGVHFKVLKSIIGGCPETKEYEFTIPAFAETAQCLLAWTWFNKVGNREMYMNCAVVDIEGAGTSNKRTVSKGQAANKSDKRDAAKVAQAALSSLPDLYVANLAGINDCRTQENKDPIFDSLGNDVSYADGAKPARLSVRAGKGQCKGTGSSTAGSTHLSSSTSSGNPAGVSSQKATACNDGKWHPDGCDGSKESTTEKNQASETQKDEVLLEDKEETTEELTEESTKESEAVVDEEVEPEETAHKKHTTSGYRVKKPKYHHEDGGYSNYGDNYGLGFSLEDYGLYRQFKTREVPNEEIATSVPDPNAEAYEAFFSNDDDIIPGIEVVSDESTTFMVIQEPSTVLTIQAPTASALPYYDEKGYLIVDTPAGRPNPDNFIIPISAGRVPLASVFQHSVAAAEITAAPLGGFGGLQGFTWPTASATRPQNPAAGINDEEAVNTLETSATTIIPVEASILVTTPVVNVNILLPTTAVQPEEPLLDNADEDVEYDDDELLEIIEDVVSQQATEPAILIDPVVTSPPTFAVSGTPEIIASEGSSQIGTPLVNVIEAPSIGELPVVAGATTVGSIGEGEKEVPIVGELLDSTQTLEDLLALSNEVSEVLPRHVVPSEVSKIDVPIIYDVSERKNDAQPQPALCARAETVTKYIHSEPAAHYSTQILQRIKKRQSEKEFGIFESDDLEEGGDGMDAEPEEFFVEEWWLGGVEELDPEVEVIYTILDGEKKRQYDLASSVEDVPIIGDVVEVTEIVDQGPSDELLDYLSGSNADSEQAAIEDSTPVYSWPTLDQFIADLPGAFQGEMGVDTLTAQAAAGGAGVDEDDLTVVQKRQDPDFKYIDILEGSDGTDANPEGIFGDETDTLLAGLESPFENGKDQVEEEPITPEVTQADNSTALEAAETVSGVVVEEDAREVGQGETEPVVLIETQAYKRQDPDFEYTDISEGGDGTDANPEGIFGGEFDTLLYGLESPFVDEAEVLEQPNSTVTAPVPEVGSEDVEQPVVLPKSDASATSPPEIQSETEDIKLQSEDSLGESSLDEPVRLRKRQYEYVDSIGGEGIDFDPIAVFGKEHEGFEEILEAVNQNEEETIDEEVAEADPENSPTQTSDDSVTDETVADETDPNAAAITKRQLIPPKPINPALVVPINSASLPPLDAPQAIDWASIEPIALPAIPNTNKPSYHGDGGDGVEPGVETIFPNVTPGVSGKDWSGEGDETYEEAEAFWDEESISASTIDVYTTSSQATTQVSRASVEVTAQVFTTTVQTTTVSSVSIETPATVVVFSTTTSVAALTLVAGPVSQTQSLPANATASVIPPAILPANSEEETAEDVEVEDEEYYEEGDDGEWEWEWEYEESPEEGSALPPSAAAADIHNETATNASSSASVLLPAPITPLYPLNGTWNATASTSTPETTSTPTIGDIAKSILPFILGPGPVIPSGVSVDWPGPSSLGGVEVPASVGAIVSETTARAVTSSIAPPVSEPVVPTVTAVAVVPDIPIGSATASDAGVLVVDAVVGSVESPPKVWLGRHMRRAMMGL